MTSVPVESIMTVRTLGTTPLRFWCPYCHRTWDRGGHKEGFVKSAAMNHVAACREIVAFNLGYVSGPEFGSVITIADAERLPHWPRWRRSIKSLIASRRRSGLTPRSYR